MRSATKQTWTGRVFAIVASVCMMCMMMVMPVAAEEVADGLTATDDPKDSVMLISLGYEDDRGDFEDIKWGTCFLINDEYVLTNRHVVTMDTEEFNAFKAKVNMPNLAENDSHFKLYLYVNRDMRVKATVHDSVISKDMDFVAVKLAEKIYDRKPIALGDSNQIQTRDIVYALGYPEDSISNKNYNTRDDVSTVDGTISKVTVTENVDIIEHTAPLNIGNSGGPLLDENDNVVGINTFIAGKKNYSIQINAIKKGLDTFGIPYVDGSGTSPIADTGTDTDEDAKNEEPEEPDNTAILVELQDAVAEAKAKANEDAEFTEESMEALNDSIGTAEAVQKKGNDAEESEIVSATDNLNNAIAGLEVKSGPNMLLIGGIVAAIVLVIIIVIVVAVSSGKKKKVAMNKLTGAGGYPNGQPGNGMGQSRMQGTMPIQTPPPAPEGAGETTLLDAGAGETTLLGGGRAGAYLLRKKNGEKVVINQQNFKIGKERRKVNYCVADNTTVSRLHCEIVRRGADYYVTDQGSANCTYVNGVQLSPNKETLLSDRSVLKLSDEEFEFHLS